MSIFSKLTNWMTGNSTEQHSGSQTALPSVTAHDNVQQIGVDAALQVSTVWACVKLLVETIASLPLFVYQSDDEGNRKPAKSALIYKLLHKSPNDYQTSMEFWSFMLFNLFMRGNAFASLKRNGRGEVTGLFPLAADQISVDRLKDGSVVYTYTADKKDYIFASADMLHIKGSIGTDVVGMAPLELMRSSLGISINSQNHTSSLYRKKGRHAGILMSDQVLTADQRQALRQSFGELATGGDKELFILEAQFKFEPLGMTPEDMQLLETRQFAVKELCKWFGVPPVMIDETEGSTTLGSSMAEVIAGFYKKTIRPQLENIEQALDKRVLTTAQRTMGLSCEFNFDALLRASLKDRMEIYARATQNGIMSRNECRRKENLPQVEGGDALTVQTNLLPIQMLGQQVTQGAAYENTEEPINQ